MYFVARIHEKAAHMCLQVATAAQLLIIFFVTNMTRAQILQVQTWGFGEIFGAQGISEASRRLKSTSQLTRIASLTNKHFWNVSGAIWNFILAPCAFFRWRANFLTISWKSKLCQILVHFTFLWSQRLLDVEFRRTNLLGHSKLSKGFKKIRKKLIWHFYIAVIQNFGCGVAQSHSYW